MNTLECYIGEVFSIKDVTNEWNLQLTGTDDEDMMIQAGESHMVEVDFSYNCYGDTKRVKRWYTQDQWDKIKERGYFMA